MLGIPWFPSSIKNSRPRLGLFLILMGLLVPLLIAACGGDDPTAVPQPSATNTPPPPAATSVPDPTSAPDPVMEITDASMVLNNEGTSGLHLVDAEGMSLYLFTNDERNVSNCSGGCAEAWPPLLTLENTLAGDGLDLERVSSIERADGSNQVTYNGKPLYYFASVLNSGDTLGQDRGDVWFLV